MKVFNSAAEPARKSSRLRCGRLEHERFKTFDNLMLIPVYNSLLQVSHNLSNGFSKEQPIQIQSLLLGNFFTFILGRHYYYPRKCLVIHYQSLCPKCEGTEVSKMG